MLIGDGAREAAHPGVVSGVRGTTVLLNRVPRGEVERIARYYWVRRIAPQ